MRITNRRGPSTLSRRTPYVTIIVSGEVSPFSNRILEPVGQKGGNPVDKRFVHLEMREFGYSYTVRNAIKGFLKSLRMLLLLSFCFQLLNEVCEHTQIAVFRQIEFPREPFSLYYGVLSTLSYQRLVESFSVCTTSVQL